MTVHADTVDTPEQDAPQFELSDREIAILGGNDPDKVQADETTAEPKDGVNEGTDAQDTTPAVAGKIEAAWITAETESEAESYGLSKDELIELGDEDSYKRTKRVLDRHLFQEGQRAMQPAAPAGTDATQGSKDAATAGKFEKYDLDKLKAEGYDDNILKLYAQQNEFLDIIESQRQQQAQHAHQAHIQEFHTVADTLDADLFGKVFQDGKPVKPSKAHDENRQKLYDAAETIVAGIFAKAQAAKQEPKIPPMQTLLSRAKDYVFADVIRERANKQRSKQLTDQSRLRRPAPGRTNRTTPSVAVETDPIKAIVKSPDIQRFWANAQEANGVAA